MNRIGTTILCPKCGKIAGWNSYFGRYVCTSTKCNWEGDAPMPEGKVNDVRMCPYCGNEKSKIGESTATKRDGYLYRVRTCPECLQSWRTYEVKAEDFHKILRFYRAAHQLFEKYGEPLKE